MTKAKINKEYGVSPKGEAVWPKLHEEDIYDGAPAGYKVELKMPKSIALKEFGKLQEQLERFFEETKNSLDAKAAKKLVLTDLLNDNEDGTMSVKFSSKYKPVAYDARGDIIEEIPAIWGGSVLRVAYEYTKPHCKSGKAGFKMSMNSVQIIELKTGGGAGGSPFDAEEGGYTYEAPVPKSPFASVPAKDFEY